MVAALAGCVAGAPTATDTAAGASTAPVRATASPHAPRPTPTASPPGTPANRSPAVAGPRRPGFDWEELDAGTTGLAAYPVGPGGTLGSPQLPHVGRWDGRLQSDRTLHLRLWHLFEDVAPDPWQGMVTEYVVATDGVDGTLASIGPIDAAARTWSLQVDPADAGNEDDLEDTLVHEVGHLVTLGPDQVDGADGGFDTLVQALDACGREAVEEGCLRAGSYLDAFMRRFWSPERLSELEDALAIEDDDARDAALLDFYDRHEDEFVTDYAAVHPTEDIAESWATYVLYEIDDGNELWKRKVRFFDAYPELVAARQEIWDALDLQ